MPMSGMRMKWSWLLLCALNTGCVGTAPFVAGPSAAVDANWGIRRNQVLADRAWSATAETKPSWSDAYRSGFIAGYRTCLETGGSEPPTDSWSWSKYLPLQRLTGDDQRTSAEWSAGFRQGNALAQKSGVRALLVSPLAVPYADGARPKTSPVVQAAAHGPPDADVVHPKTSPVVQVVAHGPPEAAAVQRPSAVPEKGKAPETKGLFGMDFVKLTLKRPRAPVPAAPPAAAPAQATAAAHVPEGSFLPFLTRRRDKTNATPDVVQTAVSPRGTKPLQLVPSHAADGKVVDDAVGAPSKDAHAAGAVQSGLR
jgi:hypothetical protein